MPVPTTTSEPRRPSRPYLDLGREWRRRCYRLRLAFEQHVPERLRRTTLQSLSSGFVEARLFNRLLRIAQSFCKGHRVLR